MAAVAPPPGPAGTPAVWISDPAFALGLTTAEVADAPATLPAPPFCVVPPFVARGAKRSILGCWCSGLGWCCVL